MYLDQLDDYYAWGRVSWEMYDMANHDRIKDETLDIWRHR
jgi:hypothetical protein